MTSAPYAPEPAHRRLRAYAIDPSLAQRLATAPISTVTFPAPWERLEPAAGGQAQQVGDPRLVDREEGVKDDSHFVQRLRI